MLLKSFALAVMAFGLTVHADVPAPPVLPPGSGNNPTQACADKMIGNGLMGDYYKSMGDGVIVNLKGKSVYGPGGRIDIDPAKMRCSMDASPEKTSTQTLNTFLISNLEGKMTALTASRGGFKSFSSLSAQQQADVIAACYMMANSISDHATATKLVTAPLKDETLLPELQRRARAGKFSLGEGFPPAQSGQ